jgi:spermidine/putrescine transport system substrate-binding protein
MSWKKDITTMRTQNRRDFLALFGASSVALGLAACSSGSSSGGGSASASTDTARGGQVNVYTWSDYFSPTNLAKFKKQTGTTVNISTYDSDSALFSKLSLAGGATGFDIVVPTSGWIPVMSQKGLLEELDHDRIPFKYIDSTLLNKVFDPGNKYSIPKDYGVTGVLYDPEAIGGKIVSWQDFLDAGAKPGVSGKVSLNSSYELIAIPLWAQGKDWNTTDTTLINQAADEMKAFAKHVQTFNSYDLTAIETGAITLAYSDQALARTVILKNPKFEFVVPQPHSELWIDNYAIAKGAPDLNQAYSFMNFQLQPEQQITDTSYLGYPTAMAGLEARLPASVPLKQDIFISPADFERLQEWVVKPSVEGLIDNLVNEIMAAA